MTEPSWLDREPKNITEAIARIMGELGPIGKDTSSPNVPYTFRGIEDITAKAQLLCAKYGVVFYPKGEVTEIKDITVGGKPWTDTVVSVEYEVCHGPSDTSKFVKVPGIGRDNSDKGSNKGMTQAFKYALIQTFLIADPKDDGDRDRHEVDDRASRIDIEAIKEILGSIPDLTARAAAKQAFVGEFGMPDAITVTRASAALDRARELALVSISDPSVAPTAEGSDQPIRDFELDALALLLTEMEIPESEFADRCSVLLGRKVTQMRDLTFADFTVVNDTLRSLLESAAVPT